MDKLINELGKFLDVCLEHVIPFLKGKGKADKLVFFSVFCLVVRFILQEQLKISDKFWLIFALLCSIKFVIVFSDIQELKKNGYKIGFWVGVIGVVEPLVYLFYRAKNVDKRYSLIWLCLAINFGTLIVSKIMFK